MRSTPAFATVFFTAFFAGSAASQDYPTKPIRMIAPAIGGASDIAARLIGDQGRRGSRK